MSPARTREPWRLPVASPRAVRGAAWAMIRADWRAVVGVLALNCLAVAAGLAGPWLVGEIVNEVEGGTTVSTVDRLALAIVVFAVAQLLLTRFARYVGHRFGERVLARLRERFVDRALALPTSVVERAGTGDLMTRSSGDVSTVGYTLRDALPDVFLSTLQVVFILAAVFLLSPLLGLSGLVGLPVVVVVARWYLARARPAYLAQGEANSDRSENLAATANGARTIEALRVQRRRVEAGDRDVAATYRTAVRTLFLRSVLFPVTELAHTLPVAVLLLVGGLLHLHGQVSLGAVVAATLYVWQLVDPLDRILMWLEQIQAGGASFARLEGVADVVPAAPPAGGEPADDRIEVVDVRYAYAEGHDVLHGVDLSVRPGERLAIVGPSGAGKSTLGRLLAGIDAPRTGRVTVGGVALTDLAPEEARRRVVLVTQEHHVFLGTLRDNLAIASSTAGDETLLAALATVDAAWVHALPDGLDTRLGSGGERLGAAEAQQLALARVVLADPHTVILDEATALLDPTTARHTERSMAAVLRGRTVIAVAHRLHTAYDADRIAVVDGGRITELGSHDELVATGGAYAALWESWHGARPRTVRPRGPKTGPNTWASRPTGLSDTGVPAT
ncbi:ABC transporter ATP-binding protein [Actinopolymorpha pittospori]